MGGYDIEKELFQPLQTLLDQCKGAKTLSKCVTVFLHFRIIKHEWVCRKLTRRLDELIENSTALKGHLIPQMKGLSNFVAELVNFGISVRIICSLCFQTSHPGNKVGSTNHAPSERCAQCQVSIPTNNTTRPSETNCRFYSCQRHQTRRICLGCNRGLHKPTYSGRWETAAPRPGVRKRSQRSVNSTAYISTKTEFHQFLGLRLGL